MLQVAEGGAAGETNYQLMGRIGKRQREPEPEHAAKRGAAEGPEVCALLSFIPDTDPLLLLRFQWRAEEKWLRALRALGNLTTAC